MFVSPSVLSPDRANEFEPSLAAVVYPNELYPQALFERIAREGKARGLRIAGVLQHPVSADPDRRCDVVLEDLMSGQRTELFENRGGGARGCRLDMAALTEVTARMERALDHEPDLLLLNKFGKAETEGRGLASAIALALDRDIPVIIGVPARNLDAWRDFAGSLAVTFHGDNANLRSWLGRVVSRRAKARAASDLSVQ